MTLSLSNHLAADSAYEALRRDVMTGLQKTPKALLTRWFHDAAGSGLFNQITRLPEYYPTRAEAQIPFRHVARRNAGEKRMEMWLRAERCQRVRLGALEWTVEFAAGEAMLTEVSYKVCTDGVAAELAAAGLRQTRCWTDDGGDFAPSLAVK